MRGFTAMPDTSTEPTYGKAESENREGGWPGMMSIRVHELDGMYDHPILPMAGETGQLLEIQCHSKLAAKRFQRPKKGAKPDGSDDNNEAPPSVDIRSKYAVYFITRDIPLWSIVVALHNFKDPFRPVLFLSFTNAFSDLIAAMIHHCCGSGLIQKWSI